MPVVTIKTRRARKGAAASQAELMARARAEADSLLADADRVLVVYGEEAASIYYEGEARPLPRAG